MSADGWNIPVPAEDAGSDEVRFWRIDVGRGRRRGRIGPQAENCRLCCQPVVITDWANRISVDIVALGIGLRAVKLGTLRICVGPNGAAKGSHPEIRLHQRADLGLDAERERVGDGRASELATYIVSKGQTLVVPVK
ncbi:hypothetical protein SAMN05216228_103520 [Rhizobium tibeticum]|uniref:Uncharacterized protein n=1 Tax=Rhizobium tibeticum TaxID=501024 RepID=A0A1H8ULZ3_9HYPH|nr:hypothetical protein [Rhizobium tibeticum]SEI17590.1 hypothetical protein RTCCBAU85039_5662 [Rhizobium tibeticum]SEP04232.1 hypothetical protein SAMN05216228_103520 [Rhizobium tibeticum]